MFEKITIIGIGLIGSSLCRDIKKSNVTKKLIAADVSADVCAKAQELQLADLVTEDLALAVKESELVVLCAPVGQYESIAKIIGPALKEGAVVSDVGSVKQDCIASVSKHLPEHAEFVGAHPIAGTEHSGPEAGMEGLFKDRWLIITPSEKADIKAVEKVSALWEACKARIEIMPPDHHDLVLGITSHLPHLIAYTIVDTADQLEDDLKSEVIKYSASGFRGFTRIAASDPVMWRDVFLHNREAVLDVLERFSEDLGAMKKAIERGDGNYLFDVFTKTRAIRREVMELKEAGVPSPERETNL